MKKTYKLWVEVAGQYYWLAVRVGKAQGQLQWKNHCIGYRTAGKQHVFFWADAPTHLIDSFAPDQALQRNPTSVCVLPSGGRPRLAVWLCASLMLCLWLMWPGQGPRVQSALAQTQTPAALQSSEPQDSNIETVYLDAPQEVVGKDEVLLDHVGKDASAVEIHGRSYEIVHSLPPSKKQPATSKVSTSKTLQKKSATKNRQPSPKRTSAVNDEQFQKAKKYFLHGQPLKAKALLGENMDQMTPEQRNLLSEIYFFECRQWVQKSEYTKALVDCQKANRAQHHDKATQFLEAMQEQAETYYLEGYSLEGVAPDRAMQKYKEAMMLGGARSTWSKKAASRLRVLQ